MRHAERIDERKQLQAYLKDQIHDNSKKAEREKLLGKQPGASSLTMQSPSFHLSADQLVFFLLFLRVFGGHIVA